MSKGSSRRFGQNYQENWDRIFKKAQKPVANGPLLTFIHPAEEREQRDRKDFTPIEQCTGSIEPTEIGRIVIDKSDYKETSIFGLYSCSGVCVERIFIKEVV